MTITDRDFLIERFFSCAIVLGIIFLLPPKLVWDCIIVFGHAHFSLTYIYQYKAGKIKKSYLIPYLLVLAILFYIAFAYAYVFAVAVGIFFLLHNFFDELSA